MTLIEVMVAITITTISVYLLSSTITASIAHTEVKRERTMAVAAAMNLIERMHSEPFGDLFALYNDDPDDDPGGPGTAPGKVFDVQGLELRNPDESMGPVGEVIMSSSTAELREDTEMESLSMPRDLNGDLLIDEVDHSDDYIVLPVTVRITWTGRAGRRSFDMSTMLAKLEKVEE